MTCVQRHKRLAKQFGFDPAFLESVDFVSVKRVLASKQLITQFVG